MAQIGIALAVTIGTVSFFNTAFSDDDDRFFSGLALTLVSGFFAIVFYFGGMQ